MIYSETETFFTPHTLHTLNSSIFCPDAPLLAFFHNFEFPPPLVPNNTFESLSPPN